MLIRRWEVHAHDYGKTTVRGRYVFLSSALRAARQMEKLSFPGWHVHDRRA